MATAGVKRGTFDPGGGVGAARKIGAVGAQPFNTGDDEALIHELRRQARTTPPIDPDEAKTLLEKASSGDRTSLDRLPAPNRGMGVWLPRAADPKGAAH